MSEKSTKIGPSKNVDLNENLCLEGVNYPETKTEDVLNVIGCSIKKEKPCGQGWQSEKMFQLLKRGSFCWKMWKEENSRIGGCGWIYIEWNPECNQG